MAASANTDNLFSMSSATLSSLPPEWLQNGMIRRADAPSLEGPARAWPLAGTLATTLGDVLPDGGLPRGAVVEIAARHGLAQGTSVALAVVASAQAESRARGADSAWCAFLDAGASLHAPAVQASGVDLARLLVVRPRPDALARVAVRVAASRVFSVVIVDLAGVPGAEVREPLARWPNAVRRLSLGVERSDTTVVLLTSIEAARAVALPTAMRLEIERSLPDRLVARVAKERFGRIGAPRGLVWGRPHAELGQSAIAHAASGQSVLAHAAPGRVHPLVARAR